MGTEIRITYSDNYVATLRMVSLKAF